MSEMAERSEDISNTALLGALVEWREDRRPMPDEGIATMYPEAVFDMSLVTTEQGRVEAINRSFFGTWKALINHNVKMIEKDVSELRILSPTDEVTHGTQTGDKKI